MPLLPEQVDNAMKVSEPASYLAKKLMGRWMDKKFPNIRLGTLAMLDPRHVTSFVVRADGLPIPVNTTSGIAL